MTNTKPNKLIDTVFESKSGIKRRKIEKIDGNHIIYSSSELQKNGKGWSDFEMLPFCCTTINAMKDWGNEVNF